MQLKRIAALAAAAIAAAGVVNAADVTVGVDIPGARVVPTLAVPALPSISVPSVDAGIQAVSAIMPTPAIEAMNPRLAPVAAPKLAQAVKVTAVLAGNEGLKVVAGQAKGDRSAALSKVYDNGSASAESAAPVAAGVVAPSASGLSARAAVAPRTPASIGLARFGYASVNASGAGFWSYMRDLWRIAMGKLGIGVQKAKEKNVDALIQNQMEKIKAERASLPLKVQNAVSLATRIEQQVKAQRQERDEMELLASKLDEMGKKDQAEALAQKLVTLEATLAENEKQLTLAQDNVKHVKEAVTAAYAQLDTDVQKLNGLASRDQMAEMNKQLNDLKSSVQIGDYSSGMKEIEDVVNKKEADVEGQKEAIEMTPEDAIQKAKDAIAGDKAKSRLDEIRAKRNAANGGTASTTPTPDAK